MFFFEETAPFFLILFVVPLQYAFNPPCSILLSEGSGYRPYSYTRIDFFSPDYISPHSPLLCIESDADSSPDTVLDRAVATLDC